jgi:hypothetical protein
MYWPEPELKSLEQQEVLNNPICLHVNALNITVDLKISWENIFKICNRECVNEKKHPCMSESGPNSANVKMVWILNNRKNGKLCVEISEKTFAEANPLRLALNELHLLYRTQHPQTLRRPTSLQYHLELYRGPQFANRIQRRNFIQKSVTPLQVKCTKS